MNKSKKETILIISVLVFLVFALTCVVVHFKTTYFTADMSKSMDAKAYLSDKYGMSEFDLLLKEYIPAKRFYYELELPHIGVSNPLWVYEYNGSEITVSANYKYHGWFLIPAGSIKNVNYIDDYDLERIYGLGLEYLQNNVDENIFAYTFNTDYLEEYYLVYDNYFSDENIENLLELCDSTIYIYSENPTQAKEDFEKKDSFSRLPHSSRFPGLTKSVVFLDEVLGNEYYCNILDEDDIDSYCRFVAGYSLNKDFFSEENFKEGHIAILDE